MGNDVDMWEMDYVFEKRLNYVPSMCGKRNKYLRNGFTVLKIIEEFDKRLICMGNNVWMWEIA